MLKLFVLATLATLTWNQNTLNISNYDYPKPTDEDSEIYNIAIWSTNDIHGAFFPKYVDLSEDKQYEFGGLEYIAKYISILRDEWQSRFLYLDGGDQFQGGLETRLSEGEIMTNYYNIMDLNGSTLGNHEWDFGMKYLKTRMEKGKYPYIVANIKNKNGEETPLPNQVKTKIYEMGKIKLGVIGWTTVTTKESTGMDLSDIDFLEYKDIITRESSALRAECDAVILWTHFGVECWNTPREMKYDLKLRKKDDSVPKCEEKDELSVWLNKLEAGTIDAVISAHKHDIVHQWISGVPVMSNNNNGHYASVMYLQFKKNENNKYIIQNSEISIESPWPACKQIFEKTKRCDPGDRNSEDDNLSDFSFHDVQIVKEEKLKKLSETWWEKYQNYTKDIIATTNADLEVTTESESVLGNLYSDFLLRVTGADISVLNSGSFRVKWIKGDISVADVFGMSPFESTIVSFEMNGVEVRKMLNQLQGGRLAFYPSSGLKQEVMMKPVRKLIKANLFDGLYDIEIQDDQTYRIATNDFMWNGGDDFASVRKWYTPRNVVKSIELRDGIIEYLRQLKKIKAENFIDQYNPRLRFVNTNFFESCSANDVGKKAKYKTIHWYPDWDKLK